MSRRGGSDLDSSPHSCQYSYKLQYVKAFQQNILNPNRSMGAELRAFGTSRARTERNLARRAPLPFARREREMRRRRRRLIPPPFLAVRSFVLSRRNHSVSTPKGRGLSLSLSPPDGRPSETERGSAGPLEGECAKLRGRPIELPPTRLFSDPLLCSVLFCGWTDGRTDGRTRTDADGRPLGGFGKFRRGGAHSSMSVCPSQRPCLCLSNGERGNREAGK